jgi:hypothetical protein
MKKNYSEDIVPPSRKRSIRDIPVPPRNNSESSYSSKDIVSPEPGREEVHGGMDSVAMPLQPREPAQETEVNENDYSVHNYADKKSKKPLFLTLGTILILVILFFILSAFDSADVTIEPKTAEASVSEEIQIENISSKTNSSSLGYRVIELSQEAEKVVPATDEEYVSQKASGVITIYNSYSSTAQKLINNTRFEAPNGNIYRIAESISVPGYTEEGGSIVPGSIDAEVFADEAGEEYNILSAKFTIPGFAGQEPYDYFSAETKTDISGGFDGVRKIISEDSIETAKSDLSTALTSKLIDALGDQVTEEFIAVYDADSFTFAEVEQEDVDGKDEALLKRRGTVKAYIFDRVELSNGIASKNISEYRDYQEVLIEDLDSMDIEIKLDIGDIEIEGDEKEIININGNAIFVWQNDEVEIKNALVGTSKSNLYNTLQNFDGIAGAEAVIKPFWKRSFPKTIEDIDIIISD